MVAARAVVACLAVCWTLLTVLPTRRASANHGSPPHSGLGRHCGHGSHHRRGYEHYRGRGSATGVRGRRVGDRFPPHRVAKWSAALGRSEDRPMAAAAGETRHGAGHVKKKGHATAAVGCNKTCPTEGSTATGRARPKGRSADGGDGRTVRIGATE